MEQAGQEQGADIFLCRQNQQSSMSCSSLLDIRGFERKRGEKNRRGVGGCLIGMQGEQELEAGSKNDEIGLTTPGPSGFRLDIFECTGRRDAHRAYCSKILGQSTPSISE